LRNWLATASTSSCPLTLTSLLTWRCNSRILATRARSSVSRRRSSFSSSSSFFLGLRVPDGRRTDRSAHEYGEHPRPLFEIAEQGRDL
jgi:hypothetical protein